MKYYIVFVVQGKKDLLFPIPTEKVRSIVRREVLRNKCRSSNLSPRSNYISFQLEIADQASVSMIANKVKGKLSSSLRYEYLWLRKQPTTFNRNIYVSAVDNPEEREAFIHANLPTGNHHRARLPCPCGCLVGKYKIGNYLRSEHVKPNGGHSLRCEHGCTRLLNYNPKIPLPDPVKSMLDDLPDISA
ncbi:MAG: transposase [Candidatus Micrarchaeota archaeon]|nr:transposase [Candidatus Micrarchaeota archaeon]